MRRIIELHLFLLLFILFLSILIGCSNNTPNQVPVNTDNTIQPAMNQNNDSNHQLLGGWEIRFDIENLTTSIATDRNLNAHYNVTSVIPDPVFIFNSWDPVEEVIDCDLVLHNPYMLDVYDVRTIVYTDSADHLLLNEDAWTSLYDIPDGFVANPFKAYAKYELNRKFAGLSYKSENLKIKCPSTNFSVRIAIDASYPGNCEEPYEISDFNHGLLLYGQGSTTQAQVTVKDWQNDVNEVSLFCRRVIGDTHVVFNRISDDRWEATITNELGATYGSYPGYIEVKSENSDDLKLYSKVFIKVSDPGSSGWVKTWGESNHEDPPTIAVDDNSCVYTAVQSGRKTYLNKTSIAGVHAWNIKWDVDQFETSTECRIDKILVDNEADFLYLTGVFNGCIDLDPGPGEDLHCSDTYQVFGVPGGPYTYYVDNAFFCKLDSHGLYQWGSTWGGFLTDQDFALGVCTFGSDLAFDKDGNILVAGHFGTHSQPIDLDPGPGEDLRSTWGNNISRFDPDGNYIEVATWESIWHDDAFRMEVNDFYEIFFCGSFLLTIDLDPGPGIFEKTAEAHTDVFLCKMDNEFNFLGGGIWGGSTLDEIKDSAIDSFNNVYFCGAYRGVLDFDPGNGVVLKTSNGQEDAYISWFNSDLELQDVFTWGGINSDLAYAIETDRTGNFYVTGTYYGSVDMDPGVDEQNLTSVGNKDISLSRFDNNGYLKWVRSWGSSNIDEGQAIAINDLSQIFFGGEFHETIDFDPGQGLDEHTSAGQEDIFVMKILPNGYWNE